MSDLVGKTWVADSGYDGCGNIDWYIIFSAKSSEHKFVGKSDNKVSVFTYNTYLCSYSPEKYEVSLLGNTNGKYIVFERKYTYKGKVYEDFLLRNCYFYPINLGWETLIFAIPIPTLIGKRLGERSV